MVVRQGMMVCAVGIVVGVLGALAAGSVLGSLLYEVNPFDPLTYVTVVAALGGTALVASWLPALRAAAVDPVVALRSD